MDDEIKKVTIRIPYGLWKRLQWAKLNEQIESIQDAAINGFVLVLRNAGKKQ